MSASKRKDVGAPNTSSLRAALGRRFADDQSEAPHEPPAPSPQPHTPHTPPKRGDAEGMTRVTLYLSKEAAQSWRQAVDSIYFGLQGTATKHQVIDELVAEAVARVDAVTARLKQ